MNINRPSYVVLFTALVTVAFTAAVMTVQVAAENKIHQNEALRYEKAVVRLFGLGDVEKLIASQIARIVQDRIETGPEVSDPQTGQRFELIRTYRSDKQPPQARSEADLLGIAFQISGNGFWAPITTLMAMKPDLSQVIGVVFLDNKETPGLGGRITEKWFEDQFQGLKFIPLAAGGKYIYISREKPEGPDDPRYGRSVDAITGATQTSLAVEKFMNRNLEQFIRAMQAGPVQDSKQTKN